MIFLRKMKIHNFATMTTTTTTANVFARIWEICWFGVPPFLQDNAFDWEYYEHRVWKWECELHWVCHIHKFRAMLSLFLPQPRIWMLLVSSTLSTHSHKHTWFRNAFSKEPIKQKVHDLKCAAYGEKQKRNVMEMPSNGTVEHTHAARTIWTPNEHLKIGFSCKCACHRTFWSCAYVCACTCTALNSICIGLGQAMAYTKLYY